MDSIEYAPGYGVDLAPAGWSDGGGGAVSFDWMNGGGLYDLAANALNIGLNTWSQKTLMQQNQEGQRYIEGQAITAAQLRQRQAASGTTMLLLLGAGVVLFMLAKD